MESYKNISKSATSFTLYKLSLAQNTKCQLMPSHWLLYEKLLGIATENDLLFLGKDIPPGVIVLFDDLVAQGIIKEYPITYDQWSEMDKLKECFLSSPGAMDVVDSFHEDEIHSNADSDVCSAVEVDLDFLDE